MNDRRFEVCTMSRGRELGCVANSHPNLVRVGRWAGSGCQGCVWAWDTNVEIEKQVVRLLWDEIEVNTAGQDSLYSVSKL